MLYWVELSTITTDTNPLNCESCGGSINALKQKKKKITIGTLSNCTDVGGPINILIIETKDLSGTVD